MIVEEMLEAIWARCEDANCVNDGLRTLKMRMYMLLLLLVARKNDTPLKRGHPKPINNLKARCHST